MTADIYQPGFDPQVGATINAFIWQDARNSQDSYDIETGWLAAVNELSAHGADQVNFSVYRRVLEDGSVTGGTHLDTVRSAIQRADELGLTVSVLPLFETDQGWRGDYNPTGAARTNFQNQYRDFVLSLAEIDGIDRLTVASELNEMVSDPNNNAYFDSLIEDVAANFEGQVGFTANFDIYQSDAFRRIWANPNLDFLGVSAYGSLIAPEDFRDVADTGPVSDEIFNRLVDAWNRELDNLESVADQFDLPVFIQEFGAVRRNFTSIFPFAVTPGDFVDESAVDRYADDPDEQAAVYRSLLHALDGRGDKIIGVDFWSWEHQADRGLRTTNQIGGVVNQFSVWPTDGAGGEALVEFLATASEMLANDEFNAADDYFSDSDSVLDVLANDSAGAHIVAIENVSGGNIERAADGTLRFQNSLRADLLSSDSSQIDDQTGFSVAIDGNRAVVGSPFHDSNSRLNNGAVFVYELTNGAWQQVAEVVSPTNRSGDLFGWSVDIEGDTIVVGSVHDDQYAFNSGAAYVLQRSDAGDWQILESLNSERVRRGDRFGVSVAIDGDLIAVGNRFGDGEFLNAGSVSIFRHNGYESYYEADVIESGLSGRYQFGWDIDLRNQRLVVGAPRSETGSAWLFTLNEYGQAWRQQALTAQSVRSGDQFGSSVAITDEGVFVGAFLHDHAGVINTGGVFRFNLDAQFQQKHVHSEFKRGDQLGWAIDANNSSFVASAVGLDTDRTNSGGVFEFSNQSGAWVQERLLTHTDSLRLGQSVAASDSVVLAGMPAGDSFVAFAQTPDSQAVTFDYTVFQAAQLINGNATDNFGASIAVDGDWAVVGAPTALTRSGVRGGAVFVFQNQDGQWNFHSRLTPSTVLGGDEFGSSVSIHDNTLVVGSRLADSGQTDAGAAYVFELNGDRWNWETRLLAAGIDAGDQFGFSVDVNEDRIVVGAVHDEANGPVNSGTATVFSRTNSGWQRVATLVSESPESGDRFGHAVALDDNSLAVTAPNANQSGEASLFFISNNRWAHQSTFAANDSVAGDEFGNSIAIRGTTVAIGASGHQSSGAAYLFQWNEGEWNQSRKFVGDGQAQSGRFGTSVDLNDSTLAIAQSGGDSSEVYLFDSSSNWSQKASFSSDAGDRGLLALSGDSVLTSGADGTVSVQDTTEYRATATIER